MIQPSRQPTARKHIVRCKRFWRKATVRPLLLLFVTCSLFLDLWCGASCFPFCSFSPAVPACLFFFYSSDSPRGSLFLPCATILASLLACIAVTCSLLSPVEVLAFFSCSSRTRYIHCGACWRASSSTHALRRNRPSSLALLKRGRQPRPKSVTLSTLALGIQFPQTTKCVEQPSARDTSPRTYSGG